VIIIPDGAADLPIEDFGGRTIFEAADIPNMDALSVCGIQGTVRTVPDGFTPGSDVAQMTLLGYSPEKYYTGRAPIEAVAMGIDVKSTDWIFRCNLVTFADGDLADHSAGHISTEEGRQVIEALQKELGSDMVKFYPGVSYRHLCVISGMDFDITTCPPHDHIGKHISKIAPQGKNSRFLIDLMKRSEEIVAGLEINQVRRDLGENPVSSIWLWGEGKKAHMDSFEKRFGLKGAAITAVDLARGLAKLIGFEVIEVEGATGLADTNYTGKANAAIKALEEKDIVLLHIEGPDEAGHSGDAELKKYAVEQIDKLVVGPVVEKLRGNEKWKVLIMPDHPTPVSTRGHIETPVPFLISGTIQAEGFGKAFTEANAAESGLYIDKGYELMEYFLNV
jgi:2,3-bisphosphoglycerate-independent phosphoglycerate mutase